MSSLDHCEVCEHLLPEDWFGQRCPECCALDREAKRAAWSTVCNECEGGPPADGR